MTEHVPIHVLQNDQDYEAAMTEYERYFDREPVAGTAAAERFELLGLVLADYERKRLPLELPDPVEAIRHVMEQRGHSQSDLAALLGSRARASELLSGKRGLSVEHIRKISRAWNVPADALIGR